MILIINNNNENNIFHLPIGLHTNLTNQQEILHVCTTDAKAQLERVQKCSARFVMKNN